MAAIDLPDTQGLGYEPLDEAWICDDHGVADCDQTEACRALPWANTEDRRLEPFVDWAREQFKNIIRPYDAARERNEDLSMPDDAFNAYWPSDWVAATALSQRQGVAS